MCSLALLEVPFKFYLSFISERIAAFSLVSCFAYFPESETNQTKPNTGPSQSKFFLEQLNPYHFSKPNIDYDMINKIWKPQTMRKSWMSKSTLFLSGCLLLLPTHKNFAAVEGGALVKGTTFTDDTSVVPASTASSKAIKWSSSDLDPSVFEIDASNPSRLKVKSAGDYFQPSPDPYPKQFVRQMFVHKFISL